MAIDHVGGVGARGLGVAASVLESADGGAGPVTFEPEGSPVTGAGGVGGEEGVGSSDPVSTAPVGADAPDFLSSASSSSPVPAGVDQVSGTVSFQSVQSFQPLSSVSPAQGAVPGATAPALEGAGGVFSASSAGGVTGASSSGLLSERVGGLSRAGGLPVAGLEGVDEGFLLEQIGGVLTEGLPGVCSGEQAVSLSGRLLEIMGDDPALASMVGDLFRRGGSF